MEIFTIYKNPKDYPDKFVVRRFVFDKPDIAPLTIQNTLELAREAIPEDKVLMTRMEDDDPVIVETWI